jgi:phosphatidylinositol-3-phosphatase
VNRLLSAKAADCGKICRQGGLANRLVYNQSTRRRQTDTPNVTSFNDQRRASRVAHCWECEASLAPDQRYCVHCGARRGALPSMIAWLIASALPSRVARPEVAPLVPVAAEPVVPLAQESGAEASPAVDTDGESGGWLAGAAMPSPRVAAIATMALLAFGVLVGSAVSPAVNSGASPAVVVAWSAPPAATQAAASSAAAAPAAAAPAATPAAAPPQQVVTVVQNTAPTTGATGPTGPASSAPALPAVRHVFLITLSDQGYNAAFGPNSQAPYLAQTLTKQGELLASYYAVASGELANGVALVSGQGPNPQTAADCPQYADVAPGTVGSDGQVAGSGCVYPKQATTLPDELTSNGQTWKAYVEDIGNGPAGQPKTCRHPAAGSADPNQAPRPGDAYVTWRNPFVYFHSVIDTPACNTSDVGLDQLTPDLKQASSTPALVYIVPNRCHDGSDQPCAPGQPAGLPAADAFLKTVVPEIEQSAAYKDGGMIAITFDQAPQTGPNADSSSCCQQPPYPNMPAGTTGPSGPSGATGATGASGASGPTGATTGGGGRVGLLLISSFVKAGSVNMTDDYNHFSLLRSIEDLFSLPHTGFAGAAGVPAFDQTVYNAGSKSTF